jgi:CHAD domain-containing protein/uncharacterized protein YjbK
MTDGTKPMEIELKLVLPGPEAESAVVAHIRERGYQVKELDPVRNVDLYLDTFDWSLMKNKLSLRYRISNGQAMYTLKSLGANEEGIAKRMETEVPLDGPVDGPAEVPAKRIHKLIDSLIFPRRLLEHIQVSTDRRRYQMLSPEGAEIELAFDASSFSLRGLHQKRRTQKLHEMEAEIHHGSATALESLASSLLATFGYSPSGASKFEVAVERFQLALPSKKTPEKLKVRLEDRLDVAVRKILTYQFQRFREQLPGVRMDIDTEFVHQARVATRRMRSALRLFREAIPLSTVTYLGEELKWLGSKFGTVRDLDVFLLNLSRFRPQIKRFPPKKKKAFENWIEKHRPAPLKALWEALESSRYKTFERRFTQFLRRPLPARPRLPLAVKPVREVAPLVITEKFEAAIQQGHKVLLKPKLKQFHVLRIQMKKLRYAIEFMAPAYKGALTPFIERTVEIQDCLGELQDTVFTGKFAEFLLDEWKGKLVDPNLLFILGEIYQLQTEIAGDRRERFGKIWERFSSEDTVNLLKGILLPQPKPLKLPDSLPSG